MYRVYQVLDGDTIDSIADKFNTDADTIQKLNDVNVIMPKMDIVVPKVKREFFIKHIVKSGDTLYEIANDHDVDLDLLLSINGLEKNKYIYPGQEILIPKKDVKIYVTKEGDTINEVAHNMGIEVVELVKGNEKIYLLPGQLLLHKKKEM